MMREDVTWRQSSFTRRRLLPSCAARRLRPVVKDATKLGHRLSNGQSSRPLWLFLPWWWPRLFKASSKATPIRSNKAATPWRTQCRERGTSALEFSIIAPVLLLLIFTLIQGGLYFYARNTAQSASREGVSYLRLAGNNADPDSFTSSAENVTEGYASKLGRLKNATAIGSIDTSTGRVTMLVTGDVVLPLGGTVEVQQSSEATLEQFRGDTRDSS